MGFDKRCITGVSAQDLDEFTCGICHEVFDTPVVTHCCGQTYCSDCITQWLLRDNTCPNDRKMLEIKDLMPAPRVVTNLLSNMRIKCVFQMNGCEEVFKLTQIENHIKTCVHNICNTCGFAKTDEIGCNCVENLINKNYALITEMETLKTLQSLEVEKLRKELLELKVSSGINSMESVIEMARNDINSYVIENRSKGLSDSLVNELIDKCKDALLKQITYREIAQHFCNETKSLSEFCTSNQWSAIVFTLGSGGTVFRAKHYITIRFNKLMFTVFTVKESDK